MREVITMAQVPCYSGSEVLFECGGAYAGTCNTTSGSCLCKPGWSSSSDVIPMVVHGGRVLSCPVHVATLKVLWGFIIVPLVASIYMYPSAFKTGWTTFLRKRSDPIQYVRRSTPSSYTSLPVDTAVNCDEDY